MFDKPVRAKVRSIKSSQEQKDKECKFSASSTGLHEQVFFCNLVIVVVVVVVFVTTLIAMIEYRSFSRVLIAS